MRLPQKPEPNPMIQQGDLVYTEYGPGIVVDHDVDNPIRNILVGDVLVSEYAVNIHVMDRDTWELAVFVSFFD